MIYDLIYFIYITIQELHAQDMPVIAFQITKILSFSFPVERHVTIERAKSFSFQRQTLPDRAGASRALGEAVAPPRGLTAALGGIGCGG